MVENPPSCMFPLQPDLEWSGSSFPCCHCHTLLPDAGAKATDGHRRVAQGVQMSLITWTAYGAISGQLDSEPQSQGQVKQNCASIWRHDITASLSLGLTWVWVWGAYLKCQIMVQIVQ